MSSNKKAGDEKPNSPLPLSAEKGLLIAIGWFLKTYPLRATSAFVFLILSGLAEGIGIAALLPLLRIILNSGSESQNQVGEFVERWLYQLGVDPTIGNLLCVIVAVMLLKALFLFLAVSQTGFFAADITRNQRRQLLKAVIFARWEYFSGERTGDFVQALGEGAAKVSGTCLQFTGFLAKLVQTLVLAGLAYLVSPWVTLVAIAVGGCSVLLLSRFITMARTAGRAQTDLMRGFVSRLIDGLTAIKPIKSMGREHRLIPLLDDDIEGLRNAQRAAIMSTEALRILPEPISTIAISLGLYFTLENWDSGLEALLVIIFLFSRMLGGVNGLQRFYRNLASGQASFWFVSNLSQNAEAAAEPSGGTITPTFSKGIRFDNVQFAYDERVVLKDVSLSIDVGQYLAVTGPSGVGKTTTADLVIGLLSPQSGSVFVDDIPLHDLNLHEWRKMIGYVPQDTVLFHDTIYANVTLGEGDIPRDDVLRALAQAEASEFIAQLPNGIDTVVGERGLKFSGGQRQRIAIARALVRRPRLLILDEATTSLDPETERGVCDTLRKLRTETSDGLLTILAISHQQALVNEADLVFRMYADSTSETVVQPTLQ